MNTSAASSMEPERASGVILRGERIALRPHRPGDEDALVKYGDNKNVSRNLDDGFPSPYTRGDAEAFIARVAKLPPLICAIELDGELIGGIGYERLPGVFRCSAKIGYWLGEPFWGRGLAAEALRLATAYAFEQDDLVRLQAWVYETNPASARVLEKVGYTCERRMPRAVIKDGRIMDAFLYARIKDESA